MKADSKTRISWKRVVGTLRASPLRTRIGEQDWRVAKSLGYLPLDLEIDLDLHPEFRGKNEKDILALVSQTLAIAKATKAWWEL